MVDPLKIFWVLTNSTYLVTKFIRNGGIDKNASAPYFDKAIYEANVDENAELQHTVLVVTAKDEYDISLIRYEITRGNVGNAFEVDHASGAIYLVAPLDYKSRNRYDLRLTASNSNKENYTSVIINVNDVNDNPPVFERSAYKVQITEEEDSANLPRTILKVQAIDADIGRPQSIVYFLSGQGIDTEYPDNSKFQINCTSGEVYVLQSLNRDLPAGRPQWRFTVFAQDENGEGLVGYADIQVSLKDVNDNAPIFSLDTYHGNISENGMAGDFVIKLLAKDYDDPLASSNAKIIYSIEQNVIDEDTDLSIFSIGAETGVIQTTICCLDREHTRDYAIQVIATDGGGLKGTCTVSIHVIDVNDNPPHFTKHEWYAETNETIGADLPDVAILTVTVQDDDEDGTNDFYYQILYNSGFGTDKFEMIRNKDGSGALKVVKPLDYEDALQRRGFRFKIFVNDRGERNDLDKDHVAYSWIVIQLLDKNDNEPIFAQETIRVVISEHAQIGCSIATFLALDADEGRHSQVSYAIESAAIDEKMQFAINQNGTVSIRRALDREVMPIHTVLVLAIDNGTPPKSATGTLVVTVEDVNDNAPKLIKDYRVVIQENCYPGKMIELFAFDPDDKIKGNGPPFLFSIDPMTDDTIRKAFSVEQIRAGANGDGSAVVSSLVSFDREYQKEYHVPIIIRDSGRPSMMGTSILTVVIGDVNDNKMKPGSKVITVYNNLAIQSIYINIGTVFVNDPDDWDLTDKSFYWKGVNHSRFKLDKDTGMLSLKRGTRSGNYQLQFAVSDRAHVQQSVDANVLVRISELRRQDVENAGSLRILGLTDEDFISKWDSKHKLAVKSRLERFQNVVGGLLKVVRQNVRVFSVQLKSRHPIVTDVRFSVPFFNAVHLNYIIQIHRKRIESEVGIHIIMVNINECLYEANKCDGSCTNKFEISALPYLVNTNTTSIVSIRIESAPSCACSTRSFGKEAATCRNYSCYNSGRCVDTVLGARCLCPAEYSGPRCQLTARSFYGNGWVLVKPLEVCQDSHIHFDFVTTEACGLLLYNGPITTDEISDKLVSDFISMELKDGYPRLLVDFGSGSTIELCIYTKDALNDGEWHRIDIFWKEENVRMVVDFCTTAGLDEQDGINPSLNKTFCEVQKTLIPKDKFLNVNTPLQIGGMLVENFDPLLYGWKFIPTLKAFTGCIRNLHLNSILFDLGNSALSINSANGCTLSNKGCRNSTTNSQCLNHGYCDGSFSHSECGCNSGWTGTACKIPTISTSFKPQSFVKYSLKFDPRRYTTILQLKFRSLERHGELFRLTDQSGLVYQILEIKNSRLVFRYNLNYMEPSECVICLSAIAVDDGQWHDAYVNRYGSAAILKVDGGEGLLINGSYSFAGPQWLIVDKNEGVYAGGKAIHRSVNTIDVFADFQNGCLDDIRLDGKLLPLPPANNETQWALATNFHNVQSGCMLNSSCENVICSKSLKCVHFWSENNCNCNQVIRSDTNNCANRDDCLKILCAKEGSCQEPIQRCCLDGTQGDNCEFLNGQALKLGIGAVSAILSCLLIILVFVIYSRRRLDPAKLKPNRDDICENVIEYDEAGGGNDDMTVFDIREESKSEETNIPIETFALEWLKEKKERIDGQVVHYLSFDDDLRNYAYEGGGCSEDSLSSLGLELEYIHQSEDIL